VRILDLFRKKKEPPVIQTEYGPTTEWARQAAMRNMQDFPEVKQRVLDKLAESTGSPELAAIEFKRRYPEIS
jgi:hypothetical protein